MEGRGETEGAGAGKSVRESEEADSVRDEVGGASSSISVR